MKKYLCTLTVAMMILMLAACGGSSGSSSGTPGKADAGEGSAQQTERSVEETETEDRSQEQTEEIMEESGTEESSLLQTEETREESGTEESSLLQTEETPDEEDQGPEEEVHPYAWLGLQDIPACDYLDILSTNHYYKESDMYIGGMSYVSEEIKAVDGINTFEDSDGSRRYSIGGMITSVNDSGQYYMQEDMTDMADSFREQYDEAMKKGTNLSGRSFMEKGEEAVPLYSEQTDDKDTYEYYEYHYPELEESGEDSYIERYYMKDGDVFAIYNKTIWGDTVIESTEIIKKMNGEIPEGTFDLPDLSGFEKKEI